MTKTINLLFAVLLSLWLGGPAWARVSLPNGTVGDVTVDMRVKTIGGTVTVDRQFDNGNWQVNRRWKPAELGGQPVGQDYCQAYPEIKIQDRTYSGDGQSWTLENRYSVRATGYFDGTGCAANRVQTLRWQDRNTGIWMEYRRGDASTLQFQLVRYGDRNNVTVSLAYDSQNRLQEVRDHFGNLILTYAYSGGQLTEIRDNPALIPGNTAAPRRVLYHYGSGGLIDQATDVLGNLTKYTYANGQLASVTDPEGRTRRYESLAGRVSKAIDAAGQATAYAYDYDKAKKQFYVRVTAPATAAGSRVTENWYDSDGILIRRDINGNTDFTLSALDPATRSQTKTDTAGRKTEMVRDEFDHLVKTTYPDGSVATASYSPQHGQLLEETDELGIKTRYGYDAKGNLLKKTEALGTADERVTDYEVDSLGQTTKVTRKGRTEANGTATPDASWQIEHDDRGLISQTTDPEGNVRQYAYDLMGNLARYTDPAGKVWSYAYDAAGNTLSETDPLGHASTYAYDKAGNLLSATDALNHTWRWAYDALDREAKSIDPYGAEYSRSYDSNGATTLVSDASGKSTRLDYDSLVRLTQATDGKGNLYQFDYTDPDGSDKGMHRPGKVRYPTFQRQYRYDERDRVTQKTDIDGTEGRVNNFSYDGTGRRKTATDANGKTRYYDYNPYGQVAQVKDPLGNTMRLVYDARSNAIEVVDPNGNKTAMAYDRRNLLVASTDPLGKATSYAYDERGWLVEITQANGQRVAYAYDDAGRISRHLEYAANGDLAKTVDYTYDAADNLTGWSDGSASATRSYDNADRLLSETVNYGGFSLTHRYTYHPNNQVKTYTGPDGVTVSYGYDALGQLEQLTIPGEGTIAVTEWQWASPKKVLFPGGAVQKSEYDGYQGLTLRKVVDPAQVTVFELQNRFGKLAELQQSTADGVVLEYRYDDATRLTAINAADGTPVETFGLDAASNRAAHSRTAAAWRYDAANQLVERGSVTYRYDESGNQTAKIDASLPEPRRTILYEYDAFNRLAKVTDGAGRAIARYAYDPFDRRLGKTLGDGADATTTHYLPSDWGLLAEADAAGHVTVGYGWNPQLENGTAPVYARVPDEANGGLRYVYYHNDHLGTPQRLTDKSGAVVWAADYDGFGRASVRPAANPATNNLRYPGQYFDAETGLHYNDRRYYDPDTGRYTARDPIGFEGGINLYTYAAASPANFTDPTGEILPCLAANYLRCFAVCMATSAAGDYLFNCQQVNWGDNAKDCATECLWDMLPIPNPCGKFGQMLGMGMGLAGGLMNSFPADTLVQVMPEGAESKEALLHKADLKPIGEIKPGDKVLAFAEWKQPGKDAEADDRLSYEKVKDIATSLHEQRLVQVTLESGETVTATEGHPFLTREGWRDAVLLKKGGQLLLKGDAEDAAPRWATVKEVSQETRTVRVFNLEVANAHTFFVGKDGVGVYNGTYGGPFSIVDWSNYPANVSKPSGPFELLDGAAYDTARKAANNANRKCRVPGKHIHEIQPVKYGGSPTNPANKVALDPPTHYQANNFWNSLQNYLTK